MLNQTVTIKNQSFTFPAGFKTIADYIACTKLNLKIMSKNTKRYQKLIDRDQAEIKRYAAVTASA